MLILNKQRGIGLVEVLVSVVLFAILGLIAVPSWVDFVKKKQLSSLAEMLDTTMKLAHSESTKRKTDITVAFVNNSAGWCFALSDTGDCNCKMANACLIGGVATVTDSSSYSNVTLTLSGLTGAKYVTFNSTRGVASDSGSITLTNSPYSIVISINKIGLISACSNNVVGYKGC